MIVLGDFVLPMTAGLPVIQNGAVAVTGTTIAAVGPRAEIECDWHAAEVLDGGIVLPGLVNTHGHAPMTLYRGLGGDVPLMEWLTKFVWPAEKRFTTAENVAKGARLAVAEMLASGTTTFADMYFFEDAVGDVCAAAGMRVRLGQAVIKFQTPDAPSGDAAIDRARTIVERWRGHPLVTMSLALHAVYTVPPEMLRSGARQAEALGVPIQIHASETRKEVADCIAQHGVTPPRLLLDTGVLKPGTVCAHGVHLTDDDIALIRDAGAGVSLNPESNLKLGSGIPDIAKLVRSGMRLGLGTDGAASNDDLDLWDAVRLAAQLPRGLAEDPTVVSAKDVMRMATLGGAELLGLDQVCGSLVPGKQADLCVVDTSSARMTPVYEPWTHLVFVTRGSDVRHTLVAGRVLYRDRRLTSIDEDAAKRDVRELAAEIAAAVG